MKSREGGATMRKIRYTEAINEALMEEMSRDNTIFVMGEGATADPYGLHNGLYERFGKERVRDTGISEVAIMGASVGAALAGYRPIANLRFCDFIVPALNELLDNAARWRYTHGGTQSVPLVVIANMGAYVGAGSEHSQCLESIIMHTPGLKLVVPSTPYDAKGLLKTAIRDNNAVVFLYHKKLIGTTGEVPEEEYTIPFGAADVKREGKDITVIATSYMVSLALEVADQLKEKGIRVEVVDPRTLEPLDIDTIVASVKKTKRVVIVDEDTSRCGVTAEISMQIMERAFDYLDAPIQRVATANLPIPCFNMEPHVLPQPQNIADAIRAVMGIREPLPVKPLERGFLRSVRADKA
jgi:acetoin:2,6-dichlorophenolindophenol oxidoreductase subunit beta